MDETKGNSQDNLQPPAGLSSEGDKGITSPTPETYTKEQVQKQVNDALAQAGRDAKAISDRDEALKTRAASIEASEAKIADWQRKQDEAELAALGDNPEAVTLYQKGKAVEEAKATLRKDKEELTRDKAQHAEDLKFAQEARREKEIGAIATKHGVDPVMLKDMNLSLEQSEAVAQVMAKKGGETPTPGLLPDSSMTGGAPKDLSGKSPMELATQGYNEKKPKK